MSAGQRILRVLLGSGSQYLDCLVPSLRLQSAATGPGAGARQLNLRVRNSVGDQEIVTPRLAFSKRVSGSNCPCGSCDSWDGPRFGLRLQTLLRALKIQL